MDARTRRLARVCIAAAAVAAALSVVPSTRAAPNSVRDLPLVFALRVDARGLERLAMAVATPGSPEYGHYEPVAFIARRFGSPAAVRRRVLTWLHGHGARDARVDATGLLAEARLDVGVAERAFSVRLGTAHAADGAAYEISRSPARVPKALVGSVQGVYGMDTRALLSMSPETAGLPAVNSEAPQPSSEQPRTGTPNGCAAGAGAGEVANDPSTAAFTPNQYLTAYGIASLHAQGLQGQGQRVAMIETDGVRRSDVAAFARCEGLGRVPPIHQFDVGLSRTPPPGAEATLDTEILEAAAGGLDEIDLYETTPEVSDLLRALTAPLQQPRLKPQVMSVSLGACEPVVRAALGSAGLRAAEFALAAAALSGVSVVAASGDTGSAGCQRVGRPPEPRLAVLYPASSPFVTAVGGTNLDLTPENRISDEIVWNDASLHLGAGGGGLSSIIPRPSYQAHVVSAHRRAVPDVSMLADMVPGYAIYCTARECRHESPASPWLRAWGTSAAAPLFAGGLALVDQALRTREQAYLGFLNPVLYALGGSPVFHDVTRIGNDLGAFLSGRGRPLGCCAARPGYDEASGLGSVDIAELATNALAMQPPRAVDIRAAVPGRQHPITSGRLLVRISCSSECSAIAHVGIELGGSDFLDGIRSAPAHIPHPGARTVRLRFTHAQLATLRRALHRHVRITGFLYAVLTTSSQAVERDSAPVRFAIKS